MCDEIIKSLSRRNEFIELLEKDIAENTKIYEENKTLLKGLKDTLNNVKDLGKYPEQTALIPLCKNLYMTGKIVHTGEFYINRNSYPNSYSVLKSLDQTVISLQNDIKEQTSVVEKFESSTNQLAERMKVLQINEAQVSEEMAAMPKEIKSEKGVALKVGEFYEILEFEEDRK